MVGETILRGGDLLKKNVFQMDGENRSGIDGSSIASFQEYLLTFEWGPIEIV